jgi:hypothetical protein
MDKLSATLDALESVLGMKRRVQDNGESKSTDRTENEVRPRPGMKPNFEQTQAVDRDRIITLCRAMGLNVSDAATDRFSGLRIPVIRFNEPNQSLTLQLDTNQEALAEPYCQCKIFEEYEITNIDTSHVTKIRDLMGQKRVDSFEELHASIPGMMHIATIWDKISNDRPNILLTQLRQRGIRYTRDHQSIFTSIFTKYSLRMEYKDQETPQEDPDDSIVIIKPDWAGLRRYSLTISISCVVGGASHRGKFLFNTDSEEEALTLISATRAPEVARLHFIITHYGNMVQ